MPSGSLRAIVLLHLVACYCLAARMSMDSMMCMTESCEKLFASEPITGKDPCQSLYCSTCPQCDGKPTGLPSERGEKTATDPATATTTTTTTTTTLTTTTITTTFCDPICYPGMCAATVCHQCDFCPKDQVVLSEIMKSDADVQSHTLTQNKPGTLTQNDPDNCRHICGLRLCTHKDCANCAFCSEATLAIAKEFDGLQGISFGQLEVPANWQSKLQAVAREAKSRVDTAISRMRQAEVDESMSRWFGAGSVEDSDVKKEIDRVLSSISTVLDNAVFVYPGSLCLQGSAGALTHAYVLPRHPQGESVNDKGQPIIYVCAMFMKSSPINQIMTLVHEASHHAAALTWDICLDEFRRQKKSTTYVEQPRDRFHDITPGMLLDEDEWKEKTGKLFRYHFAMAMLTKDSTMIFEESPTSADNCMRIANGVEPALYAAEFDTIKAIRNADNYNFFVQELVS